MNHRLVRIHPWSFTIVAVQSYTTTVHRSILGKQTGREGGRSPSWPGMSQYKWRTPPDYRRCRLRTALLGGFAAFLYGSTSPESRRCASGEARLATDVAEGIGVVNVDKGSDHNLIDTFSNNSQTRLGISEHATHMPRTHRVHQKPRLRTTTSGPLMPSVSRDDQSFRTKACHLGFAASRSPGTHAVVPPSAHAALLSRRTPCSARVVAPPRVAAR